MELKLPYSEDTTVMYSSIKQNGRLSEGTTDTTSTDGMTINGILLLVHRSLIFVGDRLSVVP